MPRVVVICVGNSLVADDGVGPAVYERLIDGELPEGMRVELLGVGGLSLLDELDGEEALVVVDAVQLGAPAGHVHELAWNDVPTAAGAPVSSHGVGVREAITIGRMLYPERMPQRVCLVGVEGRCFDQFQPMTPPVAAAVDEVVAVVRRLGAPA